jgi:hypothetical protein
LITVVLREDFGRALCLAVDARGYGQAGDLRQREWQRALRASLDGAAVAAGLHRETWWRQPKGDEEFAVLPADEPEDVVVHNLSRELDQVLERYNKGRLPAAKLRLRMALHYGVAFAGENGVPGEAAVTTSRLLNSDVAHDALTAVPEANLVLIISDRLYQDVVLRGESTPRAQKFRKVTAVCKEYREQAWLLLPAGDAHEIDLGTDEEAHVDIGRRARNPASRGIEQRADNINNFLERVEAPGSHFGPRYGCEE